MKKILKRNNGFTIVELIVVLGILAGIVMMLAKGVGGGAEAAKVNQAKVDMNGRIRSAIMLYGATLGQNDKFASKDLVNKGFLSDIKDPWGDEYSITLDKDEKVLVGPQKGGKADKAGVKPLDPIDLSNVRTY